MRPLGQSIVGHALYTRAGRLSSAISAGGGGGGRGGSTGATLGYLTSGRMSNRGTSQLVTVHGFCVVVVTEVVFLCEDSV